MPTTTLPVVDGGPPAGEAADGQVSEVRLNAGQSYRRPAGIEHDVMNGSDQPMAFVEIEIKQPDALK